jgi:formylglycine-generating enzyme required for sulfatase activity
VVFLAITVGVIALVVNSRPSSDNNGTPPAVVTKREPTDKQAETKPPIKQPEQQPPPPSSPLPTQTVDLGSGVKMEFVLIPKGKFMMGTAKGAKYRNDDENEHQVEITKPFYLGKYPVTQEQYQILMGTNPSAHSANGAWKQTVTGLDTRQFPVEMLSWNDSKAYCATLAQRDKQGRKFRLPTEAEWEYACRAGSTTRYYFGDAPEQLGDYAWFNQNSGNRTHPVGEKKPNAWGLYDMLGNVWEWCEDWYGPYDGLAASDPLRSNRHLENSHVLRGGGFAGSQDQSRPAHRNYRLGPNHHDRDLSLRVAFNAD